MPCKITFIRFLTLATQKNKNGTGIGTNYMKLREAEQYAVCVTSYRRKREKKNKTPLEALAVETTMGCILLALDLRE